MLKKYPAGEACVTWMHDGQSSCQGATCTDCGIIIFFVNMCIQIYQSPLSICKFLIVNSSLEQLRMKMFSVGWDLGRDVDLNRWLWQL